MPGARPTRPTSRWGVVPSPEAASFEAALRPHLSDLASAARQEVERLVELGELDPHEVAAPDLLERTLVLAWRSRARRPHSLTLRAWLFVILFRIVVRIDRARYGRTLSASFLSREDDREELLDEDETFWQWFQPARDPHRPKAWRTVRRLAASLGFQEMIRSVDPAVAQAFVMAELFKVPLRGVAAALAIPQHEAEWLLATARQAMRARLADLEAKRSAGKPASQSAQDGPSCDLWPPAGPHARPGLINPDATPGSGALPTCGIGDEADPAVD